MTKQKIISVNDATEDQLGCIVNFITGNCNLVDQPKKGLLKTLAKLKVVAIDITNPHWLMPLRDMNGTNFYTYCNR